MYRHMNVDSFLARAADLHTRLCLVSMSLESLPPDWDSPGVEQRCEKLFTDLVEICTVSPLEIQKSYHINAIGYSINISDNHRANL